MYTFSVRAQTIADGPPASRSALWMEIVKEGGIVGERGRKYGRSERGRRKDDRIINIGIWK